MFIGTLILLAITEKAFNKPISVQACKNCNPKPPNQTDEACPNCGRLLKISKTKLRRSDLAKIAGIAIAIVILLSIQAPTFALTQGPAQVIIQTPSGSQGNTQILPTITGYNLSYVYRDTNFEQLSGIDEALVYLYAPGDNSKATVWVAVEVAQSQSSEHGWETCLQTWPLSQGYQPSVTQLDLRDVQTQANPPITARYFAFQYHSTNQTQLVLYWYETSTFTINGTTQQKSVQMSLITYPQSPQQVATSESQLLPFATAINNYWQPIQTWAQIALALSQNGLLLSAITAAMLVVILSYQALLNRQEKFSLIKLYNKLPVQDKLLLTAVYQAQKTRKPTAANIAAQIQTLTTAPPSVDNLTAKLEEAAKVGLLNKTIANNADEPTIIWKNQLPKRTSPFRLSWLHRQKTRSRS